MKFTSKKSTLSLVFIALLINPVVALAAPAKKANRVDNCTSFNIDNDDSGTLTEQEKIAKRDEVLFNSVDRNKICAQKVNDVQSADRDSVLQAKIHAAAMRKKDPAKQKKHSGIYLDVAIPVFAPGIPTDYDVLQEENIWPQLRRAESNRFAIMVKKALAKTKAFGTVSVVPTVKFTADLYILARIDKSNGEDIKLVVDIIDISGRRWDKGTFEHRVSLSFFRDGENKTNDPYEPVFTDIANHVLNLLASRTEESKRELKQIADIRFAESFIPEGFAQYMTMDNRGFVSLTSLPSEQDPMLLRIRPLRIKDQMFVDLLQPWYEDFFAKTDESYRIWQESMLPDAIAARQAENRVMVKGELSGSMAPLSGANADFIKKSIVEAKAHQARVDEISSNLDIEVDDHVASLQGEIIELTSRAEEQYTKWQAHLKKIYLLESPEIGRK